jgi:hypothetical protein
MQLPGPVRAVVGLLAVAAEEAKHLPDRAIELPMLAVSSALQMSLRAQQRYARLAARGDDVINRRPPTDEPPPWATFDDPVSAEDLRSIGLGHTDPALRAHAASQLLDELLGMSIDASEAADDTPPAVAPAVRTPAARKPAEKAPAKKAAARKAPAKTVPAKATRATVKKPPVKKVNAAKKASNATANSGKTISRPRHTTPSRFDTVDDD